ncbi:hypothetical protein Tco_0914641 [Tanacetum coccineum]
MLIHGLETIKNHFGDDQRATVGKASHAESGKIASSLYVQNTFKYRSTYEGGAILEKKTSSQDQMDLPRDIPLDRIEVLRYDTKEVKVRKGIMQTKTELTQKQTQQGVSDEVLVSIEGVEE